MPKILKNKKLKYLLLSLAVIFVLVSFGLFWPTAGVKAQAAGNSVVNFFANIIGNFLFWIVQLLASFLVAIIQIMVGVAKYNNFTNATAVVKGWVIVRDVCNMFFIAVLLVIAFGTIFKWETYRYNRLLGRLILMAFLINFSKFICGFFIDIFQVLMLTFVNSFANVAAGNFVQSLQLEEMLAMRTEMGAQVSFTGVVGALLLAIILLTIAVIVIAALLVSFLMRILVLWFLVILSPLAFLLKTWPGAGERYSSQWWSTFGSYLTSGPVLAFFIWLSLSVMTASSGQQMSKYEGFVVDTEEQEGIISDTGGIGGSVEEFGASTGQRFSATITKVSETENLLSFIISISLLMGSLIMAQKTGTMGSQMAGAALGKITGGLKKAATLGAATISGGALGAGLLLGRKKIKAAGQFIGTRGKALVARKLIHEDRAFFKGMKVLTPTFWQGFFKRGEILDERVKRRTAAFGQYSAEYVFKGKEASIPWHLIERANQVNEIQGLIRKAAGAGGDYRQQIVAYMNKAQSMGGDEGRLWREASTEMGTGLGNFDDDVETKLREKDISRENCRAQGYEDWQEADNYGWRSARTHLCNIHKLDRHKYDPHTIYQDMVNKEYGATSERARRLNKALWNQEARNQLSGEEMALLQQFKDKSQEKAYNEALRAPEHVKTALHSMARTGKLGMDIGHPENYTTTKDKKDNPYMVHIEDAAKEVLGEYGKQQSRRLFQMWCSYAHGRKGVDPFTGEVTPLTLDQEDMDVAQYLMLQFMSKWPVRDAQQAQIRIWLGMHADESYVGKNQALMKRGSLYDGAEEFITDNLAERIRNEEDPRKISRMAVLYKDYLDQTKEEHPDWNEDQVEGEAQKKAITRRRLESFHSLRKLMDDPAIGRNIAVGYRVTNYGQAGAKGDVPFEPIWDAFGEPDDSDFKKRSASELQEIHDKHMEELKKMRELELAEAAPEDQAVINRRWEEYMAKAGEAAKRRIDDAREGKVKEEKAEMVDISESRQNETRNRLKAEGKNFWLSEEYKNNQDKYYSQEQFENNEKVIAGLARQENVERVTGFKTAQSQAQKGGQAGLAVNFESEAFKDLNLKGAGMTLRGEQMSKAVDKISAAYLDQLIEDNLKKPLAERMSDDEIEQEVEKFTENMKKASSLRLVNKSRKGVDVRHILKHEQFHDQIDKVLGDDKLQEMWQGMSDNVQEQIKDQLKAMGYAVEQMDTKEIMQEYLAEGLTNEGRYALPGGLKLEAEHRSGLDQAGLLKVEDTPEIKEVVSKAELMKIGLIAKGREAANSASVPFSSMSSKWRSWRKSRTERKNQKEHERLTAQAEEMIKDGIVDTLDDESVQKTKAWQQAKGERIKAEGSYNKGQSSRKRKVADYNQEIQDYEAKARTAASQGRLGEANNFRNLANQTRAKAKNLDEDLRKMQAAVITAKQKETRAYEEAEKASRLSGERRGELEKVLKDRKIAELGTEGLSEHLEKSVEAGIESFGGVEKYREVLMSKIGNIRSSLANKAVSIPFKIQLDMNNDLLEAKEQLKIMDRRLTQEVPGKKVEISAETKITPQEKQAFSEHVNTEEVGNASSQLMQSCEHVQTGLGDASLTVGAIQELASGFSQDIRNLENALTNSIEKTGDKTGNASKLVEEKIKPAQREAGWIAGQDFRDRQVREDSIYRLNQIAGLLNNLLRTSGVKGKNVPEREINKIA